MSDERDFLKKHAGFCCFPLPETNRKTLCNEMTFMVDGKFPPFCKRHTEEVRKILYQKQRTPVKSKSIRARGGK